MKAAIVLLSLCCCATALGQSYPLDVRSFGVRLPDIEQNEIGKRIKSGDVIWYKLPQMWQHYVPAGRIEKKHSAFDRVTWELVGARWGVYSVAFRSELNANKDFPWEGTVGLNAVMKDDRLASMYETVNFLMLPRDSRGNLVPICIAYNTPIHWIFPVGTIVGELVMVRHKGQWWVQEIRARKKAEFSINWDPIIMRPVADRHELTELIMKGRDYEPATKWFHFRNPEQTEVMKIEGLVERLPELREDTVETLLSREFREVTFDPWSDVSHAPASDQEFSIVPKDYTFGLIQPDAVNCATCHRQTQISVRELIPKEPLILKNYDNAGNIRGSDGIFTWHPFAASMASTVESNSLTVRFREHDINNGIVKIWDARKDKELDESVYRLTEYVERSLPKYQLPYHKFLHGAKLEGPKNVAAN